MSAEETSPLLEALRQQLRSILDRPITARMFLELEQTAKLARSLLVIAKSPDAGGGENMGLMGSTLAVDNPMMGYSYGSLYGGAYGGTGVLSPSPQTETFGATMVRELVAALPALMKQKETVVRESASSLVEAIAAAREAKMDDVADKLKAKLDLLLADELPVPDVRAGVPTPPEYNGAILVQGENS